MQVELLRQTRSGLKPEKRPLVIAHMKWGRTAASRDKLLADRLPIDYTIAATLLGGRVLDDCRQSGLLPKPLGKQRRSGYLTLDQKGYINNCSDCGFMSYDREASHPLGRQAIVGVTDYHRSDPVPDGLGWDPETCTLVADERPGILSIIFKGWGGIITYTNLEARFPDRAVFVEVNSRAYGVAYRLDEPTVTPEDFNAS